LMRMSVMGLAAVGVAREEAERGGAKGASW